MDSLAQLRTRLRAFASARDWEQFHTPKNLAMALGGEAGELVAEMQWLGDTEIDDELSQGKLRQRLSDEAADVLLYLIRLTDVCDIDPVAAAQEKIDRNESRYPQQLSRGNTAKYTQLSSPEEST
ncbi:nucleotide pyrophosphohydrolase [Actinopolyspora saharensis]|uniref:NTP pyrophosphatase, house-cleaning of non-canonical NTPs n=1 Tax=Actinopolyspora saharensis TaxID=995062 RepID=A0A1H0YIS6_9ACTN|nr:nucleotide pyrophosphohydrolase [Actinopolyspora saharensis]SDQ14983.1 NTP pyrophosphatase, house-cleaning of non-canonical NTPs [Actinopolyspora saharensis]